MGEVERPQAGGAERDAADARRAAVLGRERIVPDDPDRGRRDAILGRERDSKPDRGEGRDRDRER